MFQEEKSCSSFHSKLTYQREYRGKKYKESKSFECSECEFVARVEAVFISHVNLHTPKFGEAGCLSSCQYCHYNTQTKQQLDFHIKTCHKYMLLKQQTEAAREDLSEYTDYSDVEFIDGDLYVDSARISKKWPVDEKNVKEFGNDRKVGMENQELFRDTGRPDRETIFVASSSKFSCSKPKLWWEQLFGGEIKRHESMSSAEKRFPCKFCGERFSFSSTAKRHEKTHLKVKEFPCYLCKKGFTRNYSLKAHMAIRHPGH